MQKRQSVGLSGWLHFLAHVKTYFKIKASIKQGNILDLNLMMDNTFMQLYWECSCGMSAFASPDVPAGLGMVLLLLLVPPDTPCTSNTTNAAR